MRYFRKQIEHYIIAKHFNLCLTSHWLHGRRADSLPLAISRLKFCAGGCREGEFLLCSTVFAAAVDVNFLIILGRAGWNSRDEVISWLPASLSLALHAYTRRRIPHGHHFTWWTRVVARWQIRVPHTSILAPLALQAMYMYLRIRPLGWRLAFILSVWQELSFN